MFLFIFLFLAFLLIKLKFLRQGYSDTAAGAIIMAFGIFINGALKNIHFLDKSAGMFFTMILFLLWLFIGASYAGSIIQKNFQESHLQNPIKSFAVGTWVAGTSVCGIAIYQRIQALAPFTQMMFISNILLWLFYLIVFFRGYREIFKRKLMNKVHGVLLLSTVSTQSLVVFGNTVFDGKFPAAVSRLLIIMGVFFYFFAFVLIIKRYFFSSGWKVEDDWFNTNCILHGAMSITGLASAVSKAVAQNIVIMIWLWILLWFAVVEIIEIYRAFRRIKRYGIVNGVFVYDVTQWSRIFTFGMFYTFTMKLKLEGSVLSSAFLVNVKEAILRCGTWVMVIILVLEMILFFKNKSIIAPANKNNL